MVDSRGVMTRVPYSRAVRHLVDHALSVPLRRQGHILQIGYHPEATEALVENIKNGTDLHIVGLSAQTIREIAMIEGGGRRFLKYPIREVLRIGAGMPDNVRQFDAIFTIAPPESAWDPVRGMKLLIQALNPNGLLIAYEYPGEQTYWDLVVDYMRVSRIEIKEGVHMVVGWKSSAVVR